MGTPPFYRVASLTTNPNSLGIILMLSQIATLFLWKAGYIKKTRFLFLYMLQFIALLLTQSRAAIITTFIMIAVFLALTSNNYLKRLRTYIISFALILTGIAIVSSGRFRLLSRFQTGIGNRNMAWNVLFNEIINRPIIGLGFGVSGEVALYDVGIKAHNIYINCLSELGVIGFFLFMCIWILGIIFSFKGAINNKNNEKVKTTFALIFTILFALIFHQMVENKLLVYDYVMFLWIYLISVSTMELPNIDTDTCGK